jgi:hypothetical protein
MWTYSQKTGELAHNAAYVATGYSGHGIGKNNPDLQNVKDVGPCPRGRFIMELIVDSEGNSVDYEEKKAPVFRLIPDPADEMFGRSGFLMHGDSISVPGTASEGCIIQAHWVRENVRTSGDKDLAVTL